MRRIVGNILRAGGIAPRQATPAQVQRAEAFAAELDKAVATFEACARERGIHAAYRGLLGQPPASHHGEALTPMQAALCLGISRSKLYELMKAGDLDYVQVGPRKRVITEEALASFIRSRST